MTNRVDEFFCEHDPKKIRVISGDIPHGFWDFTGSAIVYNPYSCFGAKKETSLFIDLMNNLQVAEARAVKQSSQLIERCGISMTGVIGGLIGLRLGGPVGGVAGFAAGHFLGAHPKNQCVDCRLGDGRRFVAVMTQNNRQQFESLSVMG